VARRAQKEAAKTHKQSHEETAARSLAAFLSSFDLDSTPPSEIYTDGTYLSDKPISSTHRLSTPTLSLSLPGLPRNPDALESLRASRVRARTEWLTRFRAGQHSDIVSGVV
jgi:hypothetical protein